MGSKELMSLATRRDRFIWELDHLSMRDRAQTPKLRTNITLAIRSDGRRDEHISLLPGGRWVLVTSVFRNSWKVLCFDLQTERLGPHHSHKPMLAIPLEHNTNGLDYFRIHRFEFSTKDSTFNVIIGCVNMAKDMPPV
ncbi:hypothetical protein DL93DRAFT_2092246, partial [Clavulina sp. PMI_390]